MEVKYKPSKFGLQSLAVMLTFILIVGKVLGHLTLTWLQVFTPLVIYGVMICSIIGVLILLSFIRVLIYGQRNKD
jgi:hypothetical protein